MNIGLWLVYDILRLKMVLNIRINYEYWPTMLKV